MKKLWLLFFIVTLVNFSITAIDIFDYSDRSDRTTTCYEEFGFCPLTCLPNRSFMFTRPLYRDIGVQKPLWQEFVFNPSDTAAVQVIPIYQKSFGTRSLAKYFLFNEQYNLLIKGDDVIDKNPNTRDVRAEWLGLPSNYIGSFSVHPQQKQFGIWIEGKVPLSAFFDHEFFELLWVGMATPYQIVENNIRPSQTPPINPGSSFPRDALEALSNPALLFGKFGGEMKVSGFAEVDFKLGYNLLNRDYFEIGLYSMLVIPLHKGAKQHFIFEPFLGNNRHFGYGNGVTFKLPLVCDAECQLFSFFAYFENIYFFRHTERRCFDLISNPWSRYMLLNSKEGGRNIPAINIFTRKVRARCYNMLDLLTGFDWEVGNLQVEMAYGLWARGREQLKLDDCFPLNFGFAGVGFLPGTTIPASASLSTISEQAANDTIANIEAFIPITVQDLDLNSGAARGALCHRAHLTASYFYHDDVIEGFMTLGGYIEISQYNTALSNWGIWGKVGLSI